MVELAYRQLPEGRLCDAISETWSCLPDAIQLLTPCTVGNGWLRIVETGRFALILYDKETGRGARVALDLSRLDEWPAVKTWALKLKPKQEQDESKILTEILQAETRLYKVEKVQVHRSKIVKKEKISLCPTCGESFRGDPGGQCGYCAGENSFYEVQLDG
jgi:formylmethanofuran dehydrogenase subunit E